MEKLEFNQKFGAYLKKLRVDRNLTQADIAADMGINPQNVSEIERGKVSPTLYWIDRLSKVFKIEPESFIRGFYSESESLVSAKKEINGTTDK